MPTWMLTDMPTIFGPVRSPKEHAVKLAELMRGAPRYQGHAVYAGEVRYHHEKMCEALGWIYRRWPAVARELAKLDGVRKSKVKPCACSRGA